MNYFHSAIKNKFLSIITAIVILLILARIALPYAIKEYAQSQLNKISEYQVKIKDVDVDLYRGSYTLKSIKLWKAQAHLPAPFFSAEKVDLSIEWKALFQGRLVAKIVLMQPVINFILDPKGKNEQLTINKQWISLVESLFPLNINKVEIHEGKVFLRSYTATPPFNLYLKDIFLILTNMQNTERSRVYLPSLFETTGKTMDGAPFSGQGKFNPFLKNPTFTIKFSLRSMDVKSAANFLKHFTKVDTESGKFSFFMEAAAKEGEIKGYAKPFIKNLKINKSKNNNPLEQLYNSAANVVAKILEDRKSKTIATKINIYGKINDADTSTLSIIGYLLRHAFIQALLPQIDGSIRMQDVIIGKPS